MNTPINIISADELRSKVAAAITDALCRVETEARGLTEAAAKRAHRAGNNAAAWALDVICENARMAEETAAPACQDTGLAVFFAELGESAIVEGGLEAALNGAVRDAYAAAAGRMSACGALNRKNTGDNTPAVIHVLPVAGNGLKIKYLAKGAGSENMSRVYMLTPNSGRQGIIDSVVDCVRRAGANPCPPIVLGVGIGGTMEKAALLSKYALTRKTGTPSPDTDAAELERELLTAVNALQIGPQGLGGDDTCFAVAVETFPTHIGMLPVAVNVQCHSVRHAEIEFTAAPRKRIIPLEKNL